MTGLPKLAGSKILCKPFPKAPPTLAQKGMLITPTMDTTDTQPSFAGGW